MQTKLDTNAVQYIMQLLHASNSDVLLQMLSNISTAEYIMLHYADSFNAQSIKAMQNMHKQAAQIFQTAFIPINTETSYKASVKNKLSLSLNKVDYTVSSNGNIILPSYKVLNVAVLIQAFIQISKGGNMEQFITAELGNNYSQGQLIDFIDKHYDLYKHTQISIDKFRIIFRCFGADAETISNNAFDYYSQTKDTNNAWRKAISQFLLQELNVQDDLCKSVARLIVKD